MTRSEKLGCWLGLASLTGIILIVVGEGLSNSIVTAAGFSLLVVVMIVALILTRGDKR